MTLNVHDEDGLIWKKEMVSFLVAEPDGSVDYINGERTPIKRLEFQDDTDDRFSIVKVVMIEPEYSHELLTPYLLITIESSGNKLLGGQ